MKVNLGCPRYCEGYTCVDLFPKEERVLEMDVFEFLAQPHSGYEEIRSVNLLEHLPNVQWFLYQCFIKLSKGGRIVVVTDNAEWLPFYLPVDIAGLGVGAHAKESYAQRFNTAHYSIFSKMHLREHLAMAGFKDIRVRRVMLFARLEASGVKP